MTVSVYKKNFISHRVAGTAEKNDCIGLKKTILSLYASDYMKHNVRSVYYSKYGMLLGYRIVLLFYYALPTRQASTINV